LTAALTLAGGTAAVAQTSATCDNSANAGSNAQVRVTQQLGRAQVDISKPNSAGRKVEIEYGDELYSLKFGPDGRVRTSFALVAAENNFAISMSEAAPINCSLAVPEFAKLYRVVLRWHEPVQLDLNVIEPGGRLGETGHVNASRPNGNLAQGIGLMDIVGAVPAEGATAEVSYVVPNPTAIPANSVFGFRLDYVTRGGRPEAPYCDDHPLAAPQVEFITIDAGTVTTRKMSVNRARCREKITDARRLMPIRQ
jgi:hypothetical protein